MIGRKLFNCTPYKRFTREYRKWLIYKLQKAIPKAPSSRKYKDGIKCIGETVVVDSAKSIEEKHRDKLRWDRIFLIYIGVTFTFI